MRFGSLFAPAISLAVYYLIICAEAIACVNGSAKLIANATIVLLCGVALTIGAFVSIKKYRKEGYKPNHAAFMAVLIYSLALAAVTFAP